MAAHAVEHVGAFWGAKAAGDIQLHCGHAQIVLP